MTLVTVILTNDIVELEVSRRVSRLYMTKLTLGVMDPAGDGDIVQDSPN